MIILFIVIPARFGDDHFGSQFVELLPQLLRVQLHFWVVDDSRFHLHTPVTPALRQDVKWMGEEKMVRIRGHPGVSEDPVVRWLVEFREYRWRGHLQRMVLRSVRLLARHDKVLTLKDRINAVVRLSVVRRVRIEGCHVFKRNDFSHEYPR